MYREINCIRDEFRSFAESEVAPLADISDLENAFPSQLWRRFGKAGLLGITVPESYGGASQGYLVQTLAMEEISRAAAAGIGLAYLAHSNICVDNLYRWGDERQRQRYLPDLIAGKAVGALAMSEPQAGSDVLGGMQCQAEQRADYWIANGQKKWITNGPEADVFIVYMRTAAAARISRSITAFIVEDDMRGFRKGPPMDKLGMRGSGTCELFFDNCKIPSSQVLGETNRGVAVLMSGLDRERLVLNGGPIGVMQAALDLVLPHVQQRHQFGHSLGDFQLIQAKLADIYTRLEAARSYAYRTAAEFDAGRKSSRDAAASYLFSAEACVKTTLDVMQCLGGLGYLNDSPAGRFLRDAKLYEIGGGTSEIRRLVIARDLLQAEIDAAKGGVRAA